MRILPFSVCLLVLLSGVALSGACAQAASSAVSELLPMAPQSALQPPASQPVTSQPVTPALGSPPPLQARPQQTTEEQVEALRISKLKVIHGRPYDDPSERDIFRGYLSDTYGVTALAGTSVRALYAQARGKPEGWGTDWAGFGQRFGSSAAITVINGNVRYAMEEIFREDLRYLPCHGCSFKHKIENVLLAEITARHDVDGHRFFTLTPTVADFSGPIIAHTLWYPGAAAGPLAGTVSARTVFATRIGIRLFQEFVMERRHKDVKE